MKRVDFWIKTSNYSIIVCAIVLISKIFFRKYIESIINYVLLIGAIALFMFFLSELVQYLRKRNEER